MQRVNKCGYNLWRNFSESVLTVLELD